MKISFKKLPLLLLVPVIVLFWLLGTIAFIFALSMVNALGINEHGSGSLISAALLLMALIAGLIHALVIYLRRR